MIESENTVDVIDKIFNARSVAVVGASSHAHKDGHLTLRTIIQAGFEGPIYPVNSNGGNILGKKVYRTLAEIPGDIDLVVIIIPAKAVPSVLIEASNKGVCGAVIQSAGFREVGNFDLEKEISSICKENHIRVMGPNIQGITYVPNKLCAMFYPVITTLGPLSVVSQSGTVTAKLTEMAVNEGLGISAAVNLGNQTDICESDYLDYLIKDRNTKAVAMYLEGIKDGKRFIDSIKHAAEKKPVTILKAGRTDAGKRSAASHTGSMAVSHEVFKGVCRQFGVFAADNIETLFDSAKAFSNIKTPNGNRVVIISSSGGSNTLAVDEAESLGLRIPTLPKHLIQKIELLKIPMLHSTKNPLDLASVEAEDFLQTALIADQFDIADIILINFGDPVLNGADVALELASKINASIVVSYLGGGEEENSGRIRMQQGGLPVFSTPERAMKGIAAAVWRMNYFKNRN